MKEKTKIESNEMLVLQEADLNRKVVQISIRGANVRLDIRWWWRTEPDGKWLPSKRGIALSKADLEDLLDKDILAMGLEKIKEIENATKKEYGGKKYDKKPGQTVEKEKKIKKSVKSKKKR